MEEDVISGLRGLTIGWFCMGDEMGLWMVFRARACGTGGGGSGCRHDLD